MELTMKMLDVVQNLDVSDVGAAMRKFGWFDYIVFACMLLVCIVVGLYFCFTQSSISTQNYLVGGRTMKTFPVAMSLVASFYSGISLLGTPTEIYLYGTQYLCILGGITLMAIIFQTVFLPVIFNLNITSTYEYLERRFDRKTRIFGSVLFSIGLLCWLPLVVYVPALAFNQVTGINVHLITPFVCVICIFYTTIGGIKAVIWTDVIQTAFMIGAVILVIVKGTIDVGGIQVVLERNWESGRIEGPNFDANPLSRHTIWALILGGSIYWLQDGAVNQNMIQRYLSLPTLKAAKRALWLFVMGIFTLILICAYGGMVIYATYHKCDPLTTTLAREKDQLLPLLVMKVLGDYPGFPGLFVAGVFSAALSSLSTGLNSMAAIVLEDFYKSFFSRELTEKQSYILMKTTVVFFGIICVGLVYVVEHLGAVLQLSMSIAALAAGPSLGLFCMGILLPWVNGRGALTGGLCSLIFMSWICINAQAAIASGNLAFKHKTLSTDECNYSFTPKYINRFNGTETDKSGEIFFLYRLSYLWYTLLGCALSMIVSLIVSFLGKPLDPRDVDLALVAPFVRKFIPSRQYPNQPHPDEIIYAYKTKPSAIIEEKGIPMIEK